MGRFIPGAVTSDGGAGSAMIAPYAAGRLYAPPGLGGAGGSLPADTFVVTPFLLRPGVHSVVGLWAACSSVSGVGDVRMGLWADNAGKPGVLLKDTGVLANVSSGILKATFSAIPLDGGERGRMLHWGVVASKSMVLATQAHTSNIQGGGGEPFADLGMTPGGGVSISSGGINGVFGWTRAPATVDAPLNSEPVTNASGGGLPVGGLIFE